MVYLSRFPWGAEEGEREGFLGSDRVRRVQVLSFKRFLRFMASAALLLLGSLKYGLGSSSEQTALVQAPTSTTRDTASRQITTGPNPQTTPQHPPPPPEAHPAPPSQKPEPPPH